MRHAALAVALAACLVAGGAGAQAPAAQDMVGLPPLEAVERALAVYPPVRAARDVVRAEQANARRLEAGPYEFSLRGGYQSHNIPNGRYPEWDVGVERGVRLPGKARLDAELGAQGVEFARRAAYSAWCDGARLLLRLWYGWMRERLQLELWEKQAGHLRQQQDVVARRARAGDAPRIDVNLAESALAQAEAVVAGLRGREEGARAALERTFPGIEANPSAVPGEPRPLDNDLDWYIERVRAHNDEVRVARALSRRARLLADRAAAERTPDPALGARLSTDRSSADRIAGFYVIVPLPGEARRAFAAGEAARADSASSQEAAVVQRVGAEVAMMVGQARGAYAAWQRASAAAAGMQRHAEMLTRSWQLKEASLSDVVIARRVAVESALQAALARVEAEESRRRLLVEAHILWNDPEEEREPHGP